MSENNQAAEQAAMDDTFASNRDERDKDGAASEPTNKEEQNQPAAAGETDPNAGAGTGEGDGEGEGEQRDSETGQMVPLNELKSERQKRQETEKSLETFRKEADERQRKHEQDMAEMRGRLAATPQPQAQHRQPEPLPDPNEDPDGYNRIVIANERQRNDGRFLNMSETNARRYFGSDIVDGAFKAADAAGMLARGAFMQEPDPYGAMVEWHKRELAIGEIGTDPKAYREKLAKEIQTQVLADLQSGKLTVNGASPAQAGGQQSQQNQQRFPGTLANQTGAGPQGAQPQSDEAMAAEIFGSDRRSRQPK